MLLDESLLHVTRSLIKEKEKREENITAVMYHKLQGKHPIITSNALVDANMHEQ